MRVYLTPNSHMTVKMHAGDSLVITLEKDECLPGSLAPIAGILVHYLTTMVALGATLQVGCWARCFVSHNYTPSPGISDLGTGPPLLPDKRKTQKGLRIT